MSTEWKILPEDKAILRELAVRVRDAALNPLNQERIRLWYLHGENKCERPLLLTETDGGLLMVKPDLKLRCTEAWAQNCESQLQQSLIHFEEIGDDFPIEPYINMGWQIYISDFGVAASYERPMSDGVRGAFHIDPPLKDLERDFGLLHHRTFAVDRDSTQEGLDAAREVFDGILGVQLRGNPWWTMGLTQQAIYLIGLEELMLYMYDQPEALHRLMAFLRDDYCALLDWMETEELLNPNNTNEYVGSGSRGYTHALPQPDRVPGSPLRTQDLWTLIESQETVGVGPELYEEFIFPYENAIAQRFGRVYYGCCEPVHTRWDVLKRMANLRRVSVSPWCDEAFMAAALGTHIGYSRKPNPSLVSTEIFDEAAIRDDLYTTMALTRAHGCSTEIAMKDVHTLNNDPTRLARWVKIARDVITELY